MTNDLDWLMLLVIARIDNSAEYHRAKDILMSLGGIVPSGTNMFTAAERLSSEKRWSCDYRVHPSQTDWSELRCATEQEANDWVDRWMRGTTVTEARVVRVDRVVTRHEVSAAPMVSE